MHEEGIAEGEVIGVLDLEGPPTGWEFFQGHFSLCITQSGLSQVGRQQGP